MAGLSRLFRSLAGRTVGDESGRQEPRLAAARRLSRKEKRALATANWDAIRENLQAEVGGLVSKSIVESIYSSPPVVSPFDKAAMLQRAANRIYADTLYEILSEGEKPPFKPADRILQWAQDALDESLEDWQNRDPGMDGADDGQAQSSLDEKRSTTDAILEALHQASQNEVLQEAAHRRLEAGPH